MTVKLLATGVAAVATIGAAAAGVTSLASGDTSALQVRPVVLSAPLDPPPAPGQPALPSPQTLTDLANRVTDPGVSYETKFGLVENGISAEEGHVADHDLRKAYRNGNFPEQFAFSNIAPIGPNGASADVSITGPKFAGPVEKKLAFVDQGGTWVLQHEAAIALIQAASAVN
ncbi:Low molecular weight antigen MTB12 [Mycobacterium cookii]|uniref:Low molecular weight antigen MTB12 n=1 Tax=Mycobacterium cookii TaxID=1775 RepID=A0A7I7KUY3_9MYCO|nr:hypothetical protein [Mycobacterium cookii]MCV7328774.1 hypothetical protein [Mycobacterium cookii]BBX45401.1 low molecular weight antigen MTB12 [Mycobacterium cookii]